MLRASYILEQEQVDRAAPLIRRPRGRIRKMQQIIRNYCISVLSSLGTYNQFLGYRIWLCAAYISEPAAETGLTEKSANNSQSAQ